jgi:hypothetical protein
MSSAPHTCTATAGYVVQPPCVACGEQFQARVAAEGEVIAAAVLYWRRTGLDSLRRAIDLDAAVAKLVSLGGGK